MSIATPTPVEEPAPPIGWRTWAVVSACYAACVGVVTYPMVTRLSTDLPSIVDPLQHLWLMRWYRTCLAEGLNPLICREVQYPVGAPIGLFSPLHLQTLLFIPIS